MIQQAYSKISRRCAARMAALLLLLAACQSEPVALQLGPEEYRAWCAEGANGLVRTQYVDGLEMRVQYQPPEYLAWLHFRRMEHGTPQRYDSLLALYRGRMHFTLSFSPDTRKGARGDVSLHGISSYAEFAERMLQLNFGMRDYLELKTGQRSYKPVLAVMDAVQGLKHTRTINLAFAPERDLREFATAETFDLVYHDKVFGLGINHFVFKRAALHKLPRLLIGASGQEARARRSQ